jgi:hypothetical protein
MAYTKSTLTSRPVYGTFGVSEALGVSQPVHSDFGVSEELGDVWDTIKGGAGSVLDFFGAGIKAQGAQEALAAQLAAQQAATAKKDEGISTTTLLIGGVALAGVLFFVMRRK